LINFIKNKIDSLKALINFNKLSSESRKIVFYAEDIQSQNYLLDLVKELVDNFNEEVCYFTSDPKDTIFIEQKRFPKLKIFYIGSGFIRTWVFMNLKAEIMIMTMPDIERFHLKKSKIYQVHYLYIFHALVSTHSNYRLGAFNSYDTIFCTGKQQILEIRETEKHYKLPRKNIYKDGYRPLEFLIAENKSFKKGGSNKLKILIAPSWGEHSIFENCIEELLDSLVKCDVSIFLRPHPMILRNNYDQIQRLKSRYANKMNFHIQENPINRNILFESDLLITDWSGIGIEYGLGLQKPILYIDMPKKNFNPEYHLIDQTPMEVTIRSEIGKIIDIKDLGNINEIISKAISSYSADEVLKIREKYVFMKKNSLYKAAKRVVSIANANRTRNLNQSD
jgi:hypothetical protein